MFLSASMSGQPQPHPHRAALDHLINGGLQIVDQAVALAQIPYPPDARAHLITASSAAYERASRPIRRAILLAKHLDDAATRAARQRTAARKRILREVEDRIEREQPRAETRERLQAELLDRLDSPDLLDDIETIPVPDIIANTIRDLGVDRQPPGVQPHKRRTPADIALLCTRAAASPPRKHRPPNSQSAATPAAAQPSAASPAAAPQPRPSPAMPPRDPQPGGRFLQDLLARQLE